MTHARWSLLVLLIATTAQSAPAPFPKTPATANAPATVAMLQRQLQERGLVVQEIRRSSRPGEWEVRLILQGECRGQRVVKLVQADDRRSALAELVREGYDAERLRKVVEAELILKIYEDIR
jgi:hypothetical protein